MTTARQLQKEVKYKEWRNFNSLILRAVNLIKNGIESGVIKERKCSVRLGSGAIRIIKDYELDSDAENLVKKLSLSYKLGKTFSSRNETIILSLIQKYCTYKGLLYKFQYRLDKYIYDFCCENILIEFDEPHHKTTRQKKTDANKKVTAIKNGYKLFRFSLKNDVIDIMMRIDSNINNGAKKLADTESRLSGIVYERGVDGEGFARLRSKGDQALFGGFATLEMKKKLNVPKKRPLADFLPTITIKAKDLAAEITSFNTKKNNLRGERTITGEHVKNNKDVRDLLGKSGIRPESLPPEEDIKKLQRRLQSEGKKIAKNVKMLKDNSGDIPAAE